MADRDLQRPLTPSATHNLHDSEPGFRSLVCGLNEYALYMLDPNGIVVSWNAGAERIKGYRADEIVGRHFSRFYTQEDRDAGLPMRSLEIAAKQSRFEAEGQRVREDGTTFWAKVVIEPIRDEAGDLVGFAKITRDITDRARARNELHRAQQFLHLLIENIPETIIVRDVRTRRVTMLNRAAEEFLGMPRAEALGKTPDQMYPAEFAAKVRREDAELFRAGVLRIENQLMELNSKGQITVILNRKLLRDGAGEPEYMLTVIHDITERKRAEERIEHLARHDPLTDLPNRATFNVRLARAIASAEEFGGRFAVLGVDLDRLKEVNDVFGHAAGDQLLREVSRRLLFAVGDAFIARLGGDEFAVITEDAVSTANVEALTDRLLAAVGDDMEIQGARIRSGLSVGVAVYPDDGRDATTFSPRPTPRSTAPRRRRAASRGFCGRTWTSGYGSGTPCVTI